MAHPLELSYNWRTPAVLASVGATISVGAVARSQSSGWLPVLVIVIVLWAVFMATVYLRTRAYLMADGSRLTVRRYRAFHTVDAADLIAVSQYLTPHGPCYRLTVRGPDGRRQRYAAPVALLRSGHSTLFAWILARAPQAELDKGARKTVEQLQIRGLLR